MKGGTHITSTEKSGATITKQATFLCTHCGRAGHMSRQCPAAASVGQPGGNEPSHDNNNEVSCSKQPDDSTDCTAVAKVPGTRSSHRTEEEAEVTAQPVLPVGTHVSHDGTKRLTVLPRGCQIMEYYGRDLMSAHDSLCHCVSNCMAMGKGIAVLFKQRFGGLGELKKQATEPGGQVGGMAYLVRTLSDAEHAQSVEACLRDMADEARPRYWSIHPAAFESTPTAVTTTPPTSWQPTMEPFFAPLTCNQRVIFYLVTKQRYFHKPTYDTLRSSLQCMVAMMKKTGISTVSMPEIGCGLDGLQWGKVFNMLKEVLSDIGFSGGGGESRGHQEGEHGPTTATGGSTLGVKRGREPSSPSNGKPTYDDAPISHRIRINVYHYKPAQQQTSKRSK